MSRDEGSNLNQFKSDASYTWPLNSLSKDELYDIWLEVNRNSLAKPTLERFPAHWNFPLHRFAVALDFAIYFCIIPITWAATASTEILRFSFMLIFLVAFLIGKKQQINVTPSGIVGILSFITDTYFQLKSIKQSAIPSKDEVDLYSLPVMARAAEKLTNPTITSLTRILRTLEEERAVINGENQSLKSLEQDIDDEMAGSEADWRSILKPRLDKVRKLIAVNDSQIYKIQQKETELSSKLSSLEDQVAKLRNRKNLIEKLEMIDEMGPGTIEQEAAYERMIHNLLQGIDEAQVGLSEAQNIATAHELAKAEIVELLDN
jgi:hypothetical protein